MCRAIIYRRLGRASEAEAQLDAMRATNGDTTSYQYAQIYAQWGDTTQGLQWLETAVRVHDTGLKNLRRTYWSTRCVGSLASWRSSGG